MRLEEYLKRNTSFNDVSIGDILEYRGKYRTFGKHFKVIRINKITNVVTLEDILEHKICRYDIYDLDELFAYHKKNI